MSKILSSTPHGDGVGRKQTLTTWRCEGHRHLMGAVKDPECEKEGYGEVQHRGPKSLTRCCYREAQLRKRFPQLSSDPRKPTLPYRAQGPKSSFHAAFARQSYPGEGRLPALPEEKASAPAKARPLGAAGGCPARCTAAARAGRAQRGAGTRKARRLRCEEASGREGGGAQRRRRGAGVAAAARGLKGGDAMLETLRERLLSVQQDFTSG